MSFAWRMRRILLLNKPRGTGVSRAKVQLCNFTDPTHHVSNSLIGAQMFHDGDRRIRAVVFGIDDVGEAARFPE